MTQSYRIKPAISWPGGKTKLLEHILPMIPKHQCYCEPFAGGLAVLLAKKRSPIEVINDINGDLIALFRCVRFHAEALLTELEFVLNSREEFYDFREQKGLTDIQRAARWYFRNKNCFGGACMDTFGTSAVSGGASSGSRMARMEKIRELSVRLDKTTIDNRDWKECVKTYDRPETFFFFDPPYTGCDAGMYKAWTNADVMDFREFLNHRHGKWLVTLNDTPAIREIFSGCKIKAVERQRGITSKGNRRYKELIITP